jgi:hypothetical protein
MTLFKSKQNDSIGSSSELGYLLRERISPQWASFLQAFSAEMQSQLTLQEYRELLGSIGQRLAESLAVGQRETIEELEAAINQRLEGMQWGFAKLIDSGSSLNIEHHFSPLAHALNVDAETAGGLLEGVYEYWFRAAGAEADLSVKQLPGVATEAVLYFQFGRH